MSPPSAGLPLINTVPILVYSTSPLTWPFPYKHAIFQLPSENHPTCPLAASFPSDTRLRDKRGLLLSPHFTRCHLTAPRVLASAPTILHTPLWPKSPGATLLPKGKGTPQALSPSCGISFWQTGHYFLLLPSHLSPTHSLPQAPPHPTLAGEPLPAFHAFSFCPLSLRDLIQMLTSATSHKKTTPLHSCSGLSVEPDGHVHLLA